MKLSTELNKLDDEVGIHEPLTWTTAQPRDGAQIPRTESPWAQIPAPSLTS